MPTTTPAPEDLPSSTRWSLPLALGVLALAAMPLLGPDRVVVSVVACAIIGAFTVADARAKAGHLRPRAEDLSSPWLIVGVSVAIFAYGAVGPVDTATFSRLTLVSSVLYFAAVCQFAWDRLRQLAFELVIEAVIGTGGLVLLSYALLLEPWLTDGLDRTTATLAFASLAFPACSLLIVGWVLTVDRDCRCPAVVLFFACGWLLGIAHGIIIHDVFTRPLPVLLRAALALLGVCVVAASASHLSGRLMRTPALNVEASRVEHRAVMAIAAVLAGPLLIVIDQLAPFGLSMGFAAMGSAGLSVLVSAHVFRLLRKWGALEHEVHHDSLTGLPNRMFFNARLDLAIELARTERRTLAVMFLDLDRFKNVNDSLGHAAGNTLLIQVARRLRATADRSVTVARSAADSWRICCGRRSSSRWVGRERSTRRP